MARHSVHGSKMHIFVSRQLYRASFKGFLSSMLLMHVRRLLCEMASSAWMSRMYLLLADRRQIAVNTPLRLTHAFAETQQQKTRLYHPLLDLHIARHTSPLPVVHSQVFMNSMIGNLLQLLSTSTALVEEIVRSSHPCIDAVLPVDQ